MLGVLATLPVNLKSGSLIGKAAVNPKKWVSTHKIGGKVGLHGKISDFSVRDKNFIAKMTTI